MGSGMFFDFFMIFHDFRASGTLGTEKKACSLPLKKIVAMYSSRYVHFRGVFLRPMIFSSPSPSPDRFLRVKIENSNDVLKVPSLNGQIF